MPRPDRSTRRIAFASVAVGTFMSTLDASVVNVALPTLAEELGGGFGSVEWVVLSYMLALIGLQLNAGRLSDLFGRSRIYAFGLGLFALASASCAAADSIPFLIVSRAVQGVGGAMMSAVGPAILTAVFPSDQRGTVLGWMGLAVSAGLASGPAVGGLLIDALSWRWIFLPNVPLAALAAVAVLRADPGDGRAERARIDPGGAVLLALWLTVFALGLSLAGRRGPTDPATIAFAVAFPVLGWVFVRFEKRHPAPVVDLDLFRDRLFAGSALAGFLVFVTVGAVNLVIPFFLTEVHGLSTRGMGTVLSALPLALAIVAPLSGAAADRTGAIRAIATGGAFAAALALLALALLAPVARPAAIAACLGGMGLAIGTFQSPNNAALMGAVPRDRLGTAGGVLATVRVTGMLVGNALGAAIFAAASGPGPGLRTAAFVGAGAGTLAAIASAARGRSRPAA